MDNEAFVDGQDNEDQDDKEQFNNFQFTAARPSSAFSLMSAVTSRYAGEDMSQSKNSAD